MNAITPHIVAAPVKLETITVRVADVTDAAAFPNIAEAIENAHKREKADRTLREIG